ncbi:MAG: hypothetical protein G3H99_05880, partial [Ferrovum sp.]|nr:hypothetical protein [Ferrovum sp.]
GLGYGAWAWNDPLFYNPYPWGYAAYAPPTVVVSQPVSPQQTDYVGPADQGGAEAPAGPQSWFYCESAKGYYPYVKSCSEPWHEVPSTPPGPIQP